MWEPCQFHRPSVIDCRAGHAAGKPVTARKRGALAPARGLDAVRRTHITDTAYPAATVADGAERERRHR